MFNRSAFAIALIACLYLAVMADDFNNVAEEETPIVQSGTSQQTSMEEKLQIRIIGKNKDGLNLYDIDQDGDFLYNISGSKQNVGVDELFCEIGFTPKQYADDEDNYLCGNGVCMDNKTFNIVGIDPVVNVAKCKP